MLAIQAARAGGPEVLEVVDIPVPTPGPGQILLRQEAIGLNFIDTYFRSGLYPAKFPVVLGQEGAGVVEAIGEGVTRFQVGDRAGFGLGGMGSYAEALLLREDKAVKLPDGIDARTAAAALLKGMTAEFLIRRCFPIAAGDAVLIHAAAGGVGLILSQWAHSLGALVIGTTSSDAKAALAKANGCDHVIRYDQGDFAPQVRELTDGAGVRVVYDGVGKTTLEGSLSSLARRGMLVTFGNASGPAPAVEPLRLSRGGSLFLTRPTLADYVTTAEELDDSAGAVFAQILSGAVKIEIGAEFALKDARAAHEALEARQTTGSTLLIP
ncbi:MAG: quinone oxidoreductase [Caulobacteraceae bacterium]|nr:MAG: quinone oxidoreductase [Caulobacteraceae bacterium]